APPRPALYTLSLHDALPISPDDIFNPPAGTDTDPAVGPQPLTTATAALNSMNDYAYSVAFLPAGTYTVAFTCDPDDPSIDESARSEEHTSELQSLRHLVCRL